MRSIYKQAEYILTTINDFEGKNVSEEGHMVKSKDAIKDLDYIIQKGLEFYNNVVSAKLHEKEPRLIYSLTTIQSQVEKLETTELNAKKLTLESAFAIWQQLEVSIAYLASECLDILHEEGN